MGRRWGGRGAERATRGREAIIQSVSVNIVRTCSNDQFPKEWTKPWAGCREHKLFAAMYIMEQSTASRTVSGVGLSAEHGSNLHIWNHDRFFTIPTHGLLEIKLGFSIENLEWILMPPPSKISRWFSKGQNSVERKARTLSRWSVARTKDAAKQRTLIPPRDPCPMLCSKRRLRPSSQHHSLGLLLGVALGIVLRWSLFKPSVFWWLSEGFLLSQVGPVLPECVRSSGWQVSFSVQFSTFFLKNSTWLFSLLHASSSSWLDVQKSLVWLNDFAITGLGSILPRRCQWMCFSKSFTSKIWSLHSVLTLHHNHILILKKNVLLENWRLWPSLLYVSLTDLWQRAENMWLKVFHFRSLYWWV